SQSAQALEDAHDYFFPPRDAIQDGIAALLTLRRYGAGTFSRIGTIPQIRVPGSPDFGRATPGPAVDWPERTLRPLWPAQPSEGSVQPLDPADQLEHHAGGHRVVGAAHGFDDEHVRARQRDRRVRVDRKAGGVGQVSQLADLKRLVRADLMVRDGLVDRFHHAAPGYRLTGPALNVQAFSRTV